MPYGTSPSGLTYKHADLPACPRFTLRKAIPSAFPHTFLRHSISQSVHSGTGILTCFPFAFAALLMLRSRLPQGGQTFPWKPWFFGVWDSHPHLATHTGILTSNLSTSPSSSASMMLERSPTI